jgi:hypothetical protein
MAHPKVTETHEALVKELETLVENAKGTIDFEGTIVFVVDPDIDTDYGDNQIGIEKLCYDKQKKTLFAHGAAYDDGARMDEAEPIDIEGLNIEELEALIEAAQP